MSFHISMAMTAVLFLFVLYYLIFFLLLGSFINPRLTPLVCCKRLGPIYVQDHISRMLSLDQSCYFALLCLNPSKQCENLILNQHSAQIHAVGSPGADFLHEVWWKSMYVVLVESGWNIYQDHLMESAWIWGNEGLCDIRYILKGSVCVLCSAIQGEPDKNILRWGAYTFSIKADLFLNWVSSPHWAGQP